MLATPPFGDWKGMHMLTLMEKENVILLDDMVETRRKEQMKARMSIHHGPDMAVQEPPKREQDDRKDRSLTLPRQTRPFPAWPTSKAGPWATRRLPGQKPLPGRTDQMIYECYDQERGRPCVTLTEPEAREDAGRGTRFNPPAWLPDSHESVDLSGASQLGGYPLTPAETGHYHYGPRGPGINTDASGSYAPFEVDPRGRLKDRPVKLYVTENHVSPRSR